MNFEEKTNQQSWPWITWSAILVLLGTVAGIVIISSGIFDPKPMGDQSELIEVGPQYISSESQATFWLEQLKPLSHQTTILLTAAYISGEKDIGYGLIVGMEQNYLKVAISPLGYLTFEPSRNASIQNDLTVETENCAEIRWRVWPHVRLNEESNEIWLDIVEGQVRTIRINREILWQGICPVTGSNIGLWLESFAGPAVVDYQELEIFADEFETE